MSKWEELKQQIVESPVWQSIFRHGYDDTPRNRVLMVSGSCFVALGRPLPSLLLTITRMVVIYVPLALLGDRLFGYQGIFGAAAVANVLVAGASYIWVMRMLHAARATLPVSATPASVNGAT